MPKQQKNHKESILTDDEFNFIFEYEKHDKRKKWKIIHAAYVIAFPSEPTVSLKLLKRRYNVRESIHAFILDKSYFSYKLILCLAVQEAATQRHDEKHGQCGAGQGGTSYRWDKPECVVRNK